MSHTADPIEKAWNRFQEGGRNRKGEQDLTILGGNFTAECIDDFLAAWQSSALPYRIWEHISRIEWGHVERAGFSAQPESLGYLQRADLFGVEGHLSMRRAGAKWFWHFIGPVGAHPPDGFASHSFMDFPAEGFRCYEESVLLWGKYDVNQQAEDVISEKSPARWWDDRVAVAELRYPIDPTERVKLQYLRLSEGGTTAFVWYQALVPASVD